MERVRGIEPLYPAWKAGALADVLHPQRMGHSGECPREDRNFKERGEDFLFFPVLLLYQKIFEKSTHFLMNQRQYS